jgi:hypothetical protein
MQPSHKNIRMFFPIETLMHTNTSSIKLLNIITWKKFNYHKTNAMHACYSSCIHACFCFLFYLSFCFCQGNWTSVLFVCQGNWTPVLLVCLGNWTPVLFVCQGNLTPALFVSQGNLTSVLFVSCSILMHKYYTFNFMDMTLTHDLFIKHKQFKMSFPRTICIT